MRSKSLIIFTICLNIIGFSILLLFILDDTEVLEIACQPLKYITYFGFVFFIPFLLIWHFYIHRSKKVKTISAIVFGSFIIFLFVYYNPVGILNESGVWKIITISYLNEKDSSRVIVIQERKSMGTGTVFGRKNRMTELVYSGPLFMITRDITQKILEQKDWIKQIHFEKIEYFADGCACTGIPCPTFHLILDQGKNVFLSNEKQYHKKSNNLDSNLIGNFQGKLPESTYQNIIHELSKLRIEDSLYLNSTCCDGLHQKLIVLYNGNKFTIETLLFSSEKKLKPLFTLLLGIPDKNIFTRSNKKVPSEEEYNPCRPSPDYLKQIK